MARSPVVRPSHGRATVARRAALLQQLLVTLDPAALLTVVTLGSVLWVCSRVIPWGLPLMAILLSWFFKYSFALLDEQAAGYRRMPVLSVEMIVGTMGEFRWLVPLLIVAMMFFLSGAASMLAGTVIAAIAGAVLVIVMPAVLIIQGWTGRLAHSLDPRLWRVVMRELGSDYVVAAACTAALVLGCIAAPALAGRVPAVVRFMLALQAWLAFITLAGSGIFRHRARLGEALPLSMAQARLQSPEALARERDAWVDAIYGSWRSGAHDSALRRLNERVAESPQPLVELRWLLDRAAAWESPALAAEVAMLLVSGLLDAGREGEALRVVRLRLQADPEFRVRSDKDRLALRLLAVRWRDELTARRLSLDSVQISPPRCERSEHRSSEVRIFVSAFLRVL